MLEASVLSGLIKTELIAAKGAAASNSDLEAFCLAIATAVINHIKAGAQVTGTVTSGAGAGGTIEGIIS